MNTATNSEAPTMANVDIRERNPAFADEFYRQLEAAKAHARHAQVTAEQSAQQTRKFIAWLRESSPCEGWVAHEVMASSEDEVREKFRGARNSWTLEVESA